MFGDQLVMLLIIWAVIAVVAVAGLVFVVSSMVTRRRTTKRARNAPES